MGLLDKVGEFLSGGLFGDIKDAVMTYLPPDLTPAQRAEIEQKTSAMLAEKQREANRALEASAAALDKRIAEQEGTASDLRIVPILGPIMLFLRGAQRPIWGFATLYMDHRWFFEVRDFTEKQQAALIVINILVLGFLFGERAIKNLEPLIIKVFAK